MAFPLNDNSSLVDNNKATQAIQRGEQNNVGTFTLTPSAASTTVKFVNCAPGKSVNITPCTANAAAALSTTYIPPATVTKGQFVVQHANNAQSDRTFFFECTGGG